MGDRWEHDVAIETIETGKAETRYPALVDGGGRTPPENVGGIHGYESFLEEIENPTNANHASRIEWLKKTGHEGRWLRNEFDEPAARERIDEIARRRRPRARQKEAKPARPKAVTSADERLKLQEKLSDQGWIDDATPAEETGAFIDAIEAATAANGIGPAAIGRLAGYGLSLQRDNDGRVALDHVGPCGLGTQIVRTPDEPGRLSIVTGITVPDERWLEGDGGRMMRQWNASRPSRRGRPPMPTGSRRASCSAAPSRWPRSDGPSSGR